MASALARGLRAGRVEAAAQDGHGRMIGSPADQRRDATMMTTTSSGGCSRCRWPGGCFASAALARRLTQRELAAKTGIPQETIARIERGRADPRVNTLDRLLGACEFGLEVMPRLGIGIDRTQIEERLAFPSTSGSPRPSTTIRISWNGAVNCGGSPNERDPSIPARPDPSNAWKRKTSGSSSLEDSPPRPTARPRLTDDLDICYARDRDNLDRLAAALAELAAVRRGVPPDSPRMPPLDARTLRAGGVFTTTTRYGDFDILASPDPQFDFVRLQDERSRRRRSMALRCGSPLFDDLMAMKRAAGRPKDRIELEILGALREELDRRD